jgi:hypothetical protein
MELFATPTSRCFLQTAPWLIQVLLVADILDEAQVGPDVHIISLSILTDVVTITYVSKFTHGLRRENCWSHQGRRVPTQLYCMGDDYVRHMASSRGYHCD